MKQNKDSRRQRGGYIGGDRTVIGYCKLTISAKNAMMEKISLHMQ